MSIALLIFSVYNLSNTFKLDDRISKIQIEKQNINKTSQLGIILICDGEYYKRFQLHKATNFLITSSTIID